MTPAQRARYYFPAWNAAAKIHGWTVHQVHSVHRQDTFGAAETNQIYQDIWHLAEEHARLNDRPLHPDDFRYACHFVVTGRYRSSNDLTNAQVERVVALFRLLTDLDDLGAMLAWNSPDQARRKRMLWWIRHNCVESYVVEICRSKFGPDDPAALNDAQLTQLHMTLKNRPAARLGTTRGPRVLSGGPPESSEPF
jgi:hypothetical protein